MGQRVTDSRVVLRRQGLRSLVTERRRKPCGSGRHGRGRVLAENPPLATAPHIRSKYLEAPGKPNPDALPIVEESMGRRGRKAMVTTIRSRDRAKTREPGNHTGASESG